MTTRTWLITGVSSGFGRALTTQLLERGDHVITLGVLRKRVAGFEAQHDLAASTDYPAGTTTKGHGQ